MPYENYTNLELRMHGVFTAEALEALRVEGEGYFTLGTLSLDQPLGFFLNQKWSKELIKRETFLSIVEYEGYSLVYNGEAVIYNGESVTYNE